MIVVYSAMGVMLLGALGIVVYARLEYEKRHDVKPSK